MEDDPADLIDRHEKLDGPSCWLALGGIPDVGKGRAGGNTPKEYEQRLDIVCVIFCRVSDVFP